MTRAWGVAVCRLWVWGLLLLVPTSLEAAPAETERLVTVAKLWGDARFFHPWLRYKEIDWDAALVQALPAIRTAGTDDEFAAAVGELLARLGDPLTRVERLPAGATKPEAPAGPAGAVRWHRWEGPALVIRLEAMAAAMAGNFFGFAKPLLDELPKAQVVVVDARVGDADLEMATWGLQMFDDELAPAPVTAPASRSVLLNGYPPQTGQTSGGYYQGFVVVPGEAYTPSHPLPERRVAFVVGSGWVPEVAGALAAAGKASIVSVGPLADAAQTVTTPLAPGWRTVMRVSETLGPRVTADVEASEGQDPLKLALELAAGPPRASAARADAPAALPPPVWRPDATYAEMTYPSAEYRLLAVFRLWNVIRYFYPYLDLIDDWEPVLAEFVPRALAAADARAYALTIAEMAARVADGHTRISGHPALDELFGEATAPVALRMVEGEPTVAEIFDAGAAKAAGLGLGDVVVSVAGEAVAARMDRMARYVAASTPQAAQARLAGLLLRGAEGAMVKVAVRGADEALRTISVPLSRRYREAVPTAARPPAYRLLSQDVGYADLTRLVPGQVDAMFDAFKATKAVVFDMRGYPNGTAWSIAPRINTRRAKIGARFRRPLRTGFELQSADLGGGSSFAFEQPLPPTVGELYTGRTLMLIDERAISQSEHTGLFFEAAADTVFVGTPTAGANGDVTSLVLPGGIRVSFTGHDVKHADGRQLQRVGLVPHVRVAPTRAGIRAGKDEVLDRALAYLAASR